MRKRKIPRKSKFVISIGIGTLVGAIGLTAVGGYKAKLRDKMQADLNRHIVKRYQNNRPLIRAMLEVVKKRRVQLEMEYNMPKKVNWWNFPNLFLTAYRGVMVEEQLLREFKEGKHKPVPRPSIPNMLAHPPPEEVRVARRSPIKYLSKNRKTLPKGGKSQA